MILLEFEVVLALELHFKVFPAFYLVSIVILTQSDLRFVSCFFFALPEMSLRTPALGTQNPLVDNCRRPDKGPLFSKLFVGW